MTEPTLALQSAIRARLVETPAVVDLVAPSSIVIGSRRPKDFPSIIFGSAQTVNAGLTFSRQHARAYLDLDVWAHDEGPTGINDIVGAVTDALRTPPAVEGVQLVDFLVSGTRYLRDPSGEHDHAIVSVEALVGWRT